MANLNIGKISINHSYDPAVQLIKNKSGAFTRIENGDETVIKADFVFITDNTYLIYLDENQIRVSSWDGKTKDIFISNFEYKITDGYLGNEVAKEKGDNMLEMRKKFIPKFYQYGKIMIISHVVDVHGGAFDRLFASNNYTIFDLEKNEIIYGVIASNSITAKSIGMISVDGTSDSLVPILVGQDLRFQFEYADREFTYESTNDDGVYTVVKINL